VAAIIFARCCPVSEEASSSLSPGVSMGPGLTAFTRMRRSFSSVVPRPGERADAAFVALYTLLAGNPLLPTIDALRMIDAPSGISGSAFCTVNSSPFTVDVEDRVVELFADLAEGRILRDARIREQDVEPPLFTLDLAEEAVEVGMVRNVAPDTVTLFPISLTADASSGSRRPVMNTTRLRRQTASPPLAQSRYWHPLRARSCRRAFPCRRASGVTALRSVSDDGVGAAQDGATGSARTMRLR